jgi:hypothetical protein
MEFVGRYPGRAFIAPIAILRFPTGCSHCGVRSLSVSDGPRGDILGPADMTIRVSRARSGGTLSRPPDNPTAVPIACLALSVTHSRTSSQVTQT